RSKRDWSSDVCSSDLQTRKAVEHLPHRGHPRLDDLVLQVRRETRDLDRDLVDLRILPHPAGGQIVQASALGDELADQIHERVEPAQIHPDMTAAAGAALGRAEVRVITRSTDADALDVSDRADGGFDGGDGGAR